MRSPGLRAGGGQGRGGVEKGQAATAEEISMERGKEESRLTGEGTEIKGGGADEEGERRGRVDGGAT